jgi:hypothetical protein
MHTQSLQKNKFFADKVLVTCQRIKVYKKNIYMYIVIKVVQFILIFIYSIEMYIYIYKTTFIWYINYFVIYLNNN